jgi:sugar lactone lactonase YvrE
MLFTRCFLQSVVMTVLAGLSVYAALAEAQVTTNPYRGIYGWEKPPQGRAQLGVVAGIYTDPDKKHIWVLTRCEGDGNACLGSKVDPVLKFDMDGNVVKAFGAGMFVWPHGFFVDHEGNVWVTEGAPAGEARGAAGHKVGKGHQVFKFSPEGKVLMTLGEAGVPGDDQTHFNGPSHVLVAPNGDIWVTDGHRGGNNRLVKFDKNGKYLMQIGGGVKSATMERGLFNDPHHIAMDSQGRLFISDRGNNRIQIFDQQGKHISVWTQFGRPSAIAIDAQDRIYVVDGTSASPRPLVDSTGRGSTRSGNEGVNNPGYESGIRIGDARTGWITEFIPETVLTTRDGNTRGVNMEFIGLDPQGNIYAGEVEGQRLVKFVRVRK